MNREQLLQAMEAILAAAEAEARDLNAAELANYDALKGQLAALDALSARRNEVAAARAAAPAPAARSTVNPAPAPTTNAIPPKQGDDTAKEFETLAQFCEAAVTNPRDPRLANHFRPRGYREDGEGNLMRSEQRMDTGSAGGFAIPTQFRETIMAVTGPTSFVRPRATVIPAGTPADAEIEIPALDQTGAAPNNVFGGVTVGWVAEGGAKPETDADFRLISLKPQEVTGYITLTDKLLRNSAAVGAFVASQLPAALDSAVDFAMISGNGIGKPLGFINSPAAYVQNRTTTMTVTVDDLVQMLSRLLGLGGSPVWLASRALLPIIVQLQDGDGRYVFLPSDVTNSPAGTLLGHPIVWHERAPGLGSKGDISLVDMKGYLIKDGSGPFIAYSEHVNFLTNKTVVKIFSNVDGKPWLTEPMTGQDGRDSSPFVVLQAK